MDRLAVSRTLTTLATVAVFALCPWTGVGADPHPGMSSNVAIISSPSVINGGTLNTSGGGFNAFTFTSLPVASVNLATLMMYDTVVLNVASPGMGCNVNALTAAQKADLIAFVGAGNKLIITDSECPPQDYSWMPYPFTTANPGAMGAPGTLTIVEDNWLSHNNMADPHWIDAVYLGTMTDAIGDMNVMTTFDPNWCIDMSGTNFLGISGPVQTYAAYPPASMTQGLIIYNGFDWDFLPFDAMLAKVWLQQLEQPFNPNVNLPCLFTPVGISLTPLVATNEVGTEHTVTATVADVLGVPQAGVLVTFDVFAGPNMGAMGVCTPNADCTTDMNGVVHFTYLGSGGVGVDSIKACFTDPQGTVICSATAIKEWTPPPYIDVYVDIKPTSCPNPLQVRSNGNVPVAILGTMDFDVTMIDPASVMLEGVAPVKWHYEDVATPFTGDPCDCHELGADGYLDLVFHVPTQDLVAAIGPVPDRTMVELTVTGFLYDGTEIIGSDCMRVQIGGPKALGPEVVELDLFTQSGPRDAVQRIVFQVPQTAEVELSVYDVSGRRVDQLFHGVETTGAHLTQWNASDHPSGVYFVRLVSGTDVVTRKIVLVR